MSHLMAGWVYALLATHMGAGIIFILSELYNYNSKQKNDTFIHVLHINPC